jgi:hypothetical protein
MTNELFTEDSLPGNALRFGTNRAPLNSKSRWDFWLPRLRPSLAAAFF